MDDVNLPPSSRKILMLLEDGGALTHKELVRRSSLAPRTVRYALKRLKDNDMIVEKFNFRDARQILYEYKDPQMVSAQ
ncbi:winged helix-turn-helix domain-containing protein [Methanoculleus thermophilus]|jgi:DNA-binding transcriptional ArsR family regulator|uniref:Winged helix-turn-helix DNA-binding n=1 Tax=Methanoculleus thermophilus TaxID=2200 RepID=A0A1G9A5F2_9EURY|nr:winged helix-turn-helix domain-containing protein [Methanoculleus thermophilus]NLN08840.1 winged helix-turn-helix domain-containing protein [Methanoculleus thermophilus]SDK22527.1 Winged helix-turn-helix DNA-binding [Methanoculleus thermophilus]HQD25718.1 winged helix-turn-helix domain-containing protein [Methanoculleus thermophilus]